MNLKSIIFLALTTIVILLSSCIQQPAALNKKEFVTHQLKIAVEKTEALVNDQLAGSPENTLRVSPRSFRNNSDFHVVASRDWTSGFFPGNLWFMYEWTADAIMENVEAGYFSPKGDNHGFILTDSTGNKPQGYEIAVPIVYADYYYLEALLRKNSMGQAQ